MSVAITIFGVEGQGGDIALCYVLLRTVRGGGNYPAPHLPGDFVSQTVRKTRVEGTGLQVVSWDDVLPSTEASSILDGISQGTFVVPSSSPICAGSSIAGVPFGPLIVQEGNERASVTGVGLLHRCGIVSPGMATDLKNSLFMHLKPGTGPRVLHLLVSQIEELRGMKALQRKERPFAAVEYFHRESLLPGVDGPLFSMRLDSMDLQRFRSRAPANHLHILRRAALLHIPYTLQVTIQNYNQILTSKLLAMPANQHEITVSVSSHITEASLSAFDMAGDLIERFDITFCQGIDIRLSVLAGADEFPQLFSGTVDTQDLDKRNRLVTSAFNAAGLQGRSGVLDIVRTSDQTLNTLLGRGGESLETIWFERDIENQAEVIRWVKKMLEQPGVSKAYLADPFLGSSAFERVVARQGNMTPELFVLISPGGVDPDAEREDSKTSEYIERLVETASRLREKVACKLSIIHVRKAENRAFHDRYLCTVKDGIPSAYLLSNSLSKAAGDWPFAVSQLDRITSWRVYTDILEMAGQLPNQRGLDPEVIWTYSPTTNAVDSASNGTSDEDQSEPRKSWANLLLSDMQRIITRNVECKDQVCQRLDKFLADCPQDVDAETLAEALFKVTIHREHFVVLTSQIFRDRGQPLVADALDEHLLTHFLDKLPTAKDQGTLFILPDHRRDVITHLAGCVARKKKPTAFILNKLNSRMFEYLETIETQRFSATIILDIHEAATYLSIIALLVATNSSDIDMRHRIGLANDYIHWIGRLMRSEMAFCIYTKCETMPEYLLDGVASMASLIARAKSIFGVEVNGAIDRVMTDQWIVPACREKLEAALAQSE